MRSRPRGLLCSRKNHPGKDEKPLREGADGDGAGPCVWVGAPSAQGGSGGQNNFNGPTPRHCSR